MTSEKRERLSAALTVNTVILIVILIAVIIYQIVTLAVVNKKKKDVRAEIAYYSQQIEVGGSRLDYLQSDEYLRLRAYELGYLD